MEELNKWFSVYLLGLVSSANDLTEITAEMIDRNPKVNECINTLLNKADNQISSVVVPEENDRIGSAVDDVFYHEFQSYKIRKEKASFDKLFGGKGERRIEFLHKNAEGDLYPLSIQKESSGTKRYFGLGGPLYKLINGSHMLCIDELETSLHPDLMKHFLQVFLMNSKNSQSLITTHNLSLMADPDFLRRDALWFSEKEPDGSVSFYSAADFDTATLRKDASLINAYKTGRLGARPNLGSPYLVTKVE